MTNMPNQHERRRDDAGAHGEEVGVLPDSAAPAQRAPHARAQAARSDEAPPFEADLAVREAVHQPHVVRRHQHRGAAEVDRLEDLHHLDRHRPVEVPGRLVREEAPPGRSRWRARSRRAAARRPRARPRATPPRSLSPTMLSTRGHAAPDLLGAAHRPPRARAPTFAPTVRRGKQLEVLKHDADVAPELRRSCGRLATSTPPIMPLRLRLTLWYGSALALILIAFSTVLYFVTARSLRDAIDQSLEETAAAAVRSLEERGFLPLIDEDELMSQFPELARIDKFFQIFSPSGTITIRSPNVKQHELPLSRRALEVAFSGQTIFESARYPKEPPLRLISVPIIYRGNCSTSCRSEPLWSRSTKR